MGEWREPCRRCGEMCWRDAETYLAWPLEDLSEEERENDDRDEQPPCQSTAPPVERRESGCPVDVWEELEARRSDPRWECLFETYDLDALPDLEVADCEITDEEAEEAFLDFLGVTKEQLLEWMHQAPGSTQGTRR